MGNDIAYINACTQRMNLSARDHAEIEEGWETILREHSQQQLSREHQRLQSLNQTRKQHQNSVSKQHQNSVSIDGKWVFNNHLETGKLANTTTSSSSGSTYTLDMIDAHRRFINLFRASIKENRRRLLDVSYKTNVMQQTNRFLDQAAFCDLESQEMSSSFAPDYARILDSIYDAYQSGGVLNLMQHRSLMRGYFKAFRFEGKRMCAEGMAIGAEFAARELGHDLKKENNPHKLGLKMQARLRNVNPCALDVVYTSVLRHAESIKTFDAIFWKMFPEVTEGLATVSRQNFKRGFMPAVAMVLSARDLEKELGLCDPHLACVKIEKEKAAQEAMWEKEELESKERSKKKLKEKENV